MKRNTIAALAVGAAVVASVAFYALKPEPVDIVRLAKRSVDLHFTLRDNSIEMTDEVYQDLKRQEAKIDAMISRLSPEERALFMQVGTLYAIQHGFARPAPDFKETPLRGAK